MYLCRYAAPEGPRYGICRDGELLALDGDPFDTPWKPGMPIGPVGRVNLLAPTVPSKIVCVGRNYIAHAQELGNEVPTEPLLFLKPPSAVIGPGAAIEILPEMGRVDHEAELAVVIGRRGRFISAAEAQHYVLGYTCANDVSDRDFQKKDGQWTRAKGFDTFCSVGPWIVADLDPADIRVTCHVNRDLRQDARTSQMVFSVPFLIAYISRIMTLEAGDLILTGTPAGVGPLAPGDRVDVSVEGIGVLSNPVVTRS